MDATGIFKLRPSTLWGDYGRILMSGLAARNHAGILELERTGPLLPEISFPARTVLIADRLKTKIDRANLGDFEFRPVFKKKIVELQWDPNDEKPPLPEGGEPENYVLLLDHSVSLSDAMDVIWELVPPVENQFEFDANTQCLSLGKDSPKSEFFLARNSLNVFVTEYGKKWLEDNNCGQWISFVDVGVRPEG